MVYADEILEKRKDEKDSSFTFSSIAEGTTTGAVIGLVGGILYAYFNHKTFVSCMVVGTITGGIVSRLFLIKR